MKKQSQNTNGTMQYLKSIEQEILDLASKGIQVPDSIKMMDDPNAQLQALEQIKEQSNLVSDATQEVNDVADQMHQTEMENIQQMEQIKNNIEISSYIKPFNLKKAQAESLEVVPREEPETQSKENNFLISLLFNGVEDFVSKYLDNVSKQIARNEILDATSKAGDELVIGHVDRFYNKMGENPEMTLFEKSKLAKPIYDHLPSDMKADAQESGVVENAEYTKLQSFVNDVNDNIKKQAQQDVKAFAKTSKKPYNLTKVAQHQTAQDIIMYGPHEKRYDPFLRQPISDWHIVERNKGYGFVVDDVWNIDWEAVWRGNIMDKYSRPYRDTKTGQWIGGYIEKRFETDKWIPADNNYQLLPGQLRKPYNPKRGSYEARLEAMRKEEAEDRGYAPASEGNPTDWNKEIFEKQSKTKVFNLKESKKKNIILSQIDEPRSPKGNSYFEGEALPQIWMCGEQRVAGPNVNCPDGSSPVSLGMQYKTTGEPEKAKEYRIKNKSPEFVQKGTNVFAQQMPPQGLKPRPKKKRKYHSNEVKMMSDPVDNTNENSDNTSVEQTCEDLCIDG